MKFGTHLYLGDIFQNLSISEVAVAKLPPLRQLCHRQKSPPSHTKKYLGLIPATNRKSAILLKGRHFCTFHLRTSPKVKNNYQENVFPSAIAVVTPPRCPPRRKSRNPHNAQMHHSNVTKLHKHACPLKLSVSKSPRATTRHARWGRSTQEARAS